MSISSLLGTLILWIYVVYATPIEDKIETQIDPRLPSSFKLREIMFSRQKGFSDVRTHDPQSNQDGGFHIGNWELYASRYWFETRTPNMLCPQLPEGIAAWCDWALLVPCLFGNVTKAPRTIFVHTLMLPHFVESTLNFLPNKSWEFVVISGGHDLTIPQLSLDARYHNLRGFGGNGGGSYFTRLINHPQVVHWFAENRDIYHPKLSALPSGGDSERPDDFSSFPPADSLLPLEQRPLMILNSDRIRSGTGQWQKRLEVAQKCRNNTFCLQPNKENSGEGIGLKDFLRHLGSVAFVACVQGGGVDPSPKAWEAIMCGTIPIMEKRMVEDAYERFPVAFVNSWNELLDDPNLGEILEYWRDRLAPYYLQGSELRKQTLDVSILYPTCLHCC